MWLLFSLKSSWLTRYFDIFLVSRSMIIFGFIEKGVNSKVVHNAVLYRVVCFHILFHCRDMKTYILLKVNYSWLWGSLNTEHTFFLLFKDIMLDLIFKKNLKKLSQFRHFLNQFKREDFYDIR